MRDYRHFSSYRGGNRHYGYHGYQGSGYGCYDTGY